ncbi:MAG: hypothetical protein GX933_02870 [Chloroflexi bacterium]|jgi:cell fate regulator YaaT (PSP1 superfamily)|nr:hypothetical protein [Chloroflexota bacterium]
MTDTYSTIVLVCLSRGGKSYHFDASGFEEIGVADYVLVETSKGQQIGLVKKKLENAKIEGDPPKKILHIATAGELVARESWSLKEAEIQEYCRNRVKELHIKDVKFLQPEINFDGSYVLVNYYSGLEEKIEMKSLRYDIQKQFEIQNVELRQLGPRDVAKSIGGMGACGIGNRCCSAYMTEFKSISIRMAKEQGISLTPAEITGLCGRLRCCLEFENELYVERRKLLPKKKKRVMTPQGEGKVLEVFPLRYSVLVDIPEVGRREFTKDQLSEIKSDPVQEE